VHAQQRTVWQWDQQEGFGDNPADEGAGANGIAFESFFPLRFPGQYFDKETNLMSSSRFFEVA